MNGAVLPAQSMPASQFTDCADKSKDHDERAQSGGNVVSVLPTLGCQVGDDADACEIERIPGDLGSAFLE